MKIEYSYKSFKRYISTLIRRLIYFYRINNLEIISSGIDSNGNCSVSLKNGLTFYGYPSTSTQNYLYPILLRKEIKKTLKKQCARVAYDIIFRFEDIPNREFYSDYKKGEVILEIGAFTGFFTMYAAQKVQNEGKVISIEALHDNYELLKCNIESNDFKNVHTIHSATWNEKSIIKFQRESRQRASSKQGVVNGDHEIEIACDTVDNLLNSKNIKHVDFVRIQVNGAEMETLLGMEKILECRPKLSVASIFKQGNSSVVDFLIEKGYSISNKSGYIYAEFEETDVTTI